MLKKPILHSYRKSNTFTQKQAVQLISDVRQGGNPILPPDELIPDVEARVFTDSNGEQRVFLYGSRDEIGSKTWCSYKYKVFSSPVNDLKNWTDHGVSFASRKGEGYIWNGKRADGISWCNTRLYAPDVNKIGDLYYLVTCNAGGPCLGMAVSKNPEGPFSPAKKILYDDGGETASIDPSLYVEGEGENQKVYLLWGQRPVFNARGLLGAELVKDTDGLYTVVKKDTERVLFTGENDEFGFYEGASIRKINGRYYILYPSDHGKGVHMMSYAIADNPLGPYKFGGDILENDGCDLRSGNNHGSFCQINGQWYLFYHRGFNNSDMQRRVCVEKIYFNADGHIGDINGNLVQMTNHGFGGPLNPYQPIGAVYATRVRQDGFTSGCYLTRSKKGLHMLSHIRDGNCVEYRDFDFRKGEKNLSFAALVSAKHSGYIDIILDSPHNTPIGTVAVQADFLRRYKEYCTPVKAVSGVHTLYLMFHTDEKKSLGTIASFRFSAVDKTGKK
ncbi:MAG: family 43 glycosylhydrolase [Candidatus Fimenecus sp.]